MHLSPTQDSYPSHPWAAPLLPSIPSCLFFSSPFPSSPLCSAFPNLPELDWGRWLRHQKLCLTVDQNSELTGGSLIPHRLPLHPHSQRFAIPSSFLAPLHQYLYANRLPRVQHVPKDESGAMQSSPSMIHVQPCAKVATVLFYEHFYMICVVICLTTITDPCHFQYSDH